jgi:hypothetical protein
LPIPARVSGTSLSDPQYIPDFDVVLERRGRIWEWYVRTTEGADAFALLPRAAKRSV